jgi:hypothetical protein
MLTSQAGVIERYNTYAAETRAARRRGHARHALKATPARLQIAGQVLAFCRAEAIDSGLWLFFLFRQRRWLLPPAFRADVLCSTRPLPAFRAGVPDLNAYRQHRLDEQQRARVESGDAGYDPNRDVSSAVEQTKARYAGDPTGCMAAMDTTLGFHPHSRICQACPCAHACAAALTARVGFDILALRAGRLTQAQAQEQARRNG